MSLSKPVFPRIYNPANQAREELIANFVVRVKEFQMIFAVIKADQMQKPPQHFIIQGQRGSGKTTLLLRLFYAINEDNDLTRFLIPVIFDEEQYGIRTLYKLWEEIALYLEEKYEILFVGLSKEMQAHLEDEDYEEKCYEVLKKRLTEKGKKLVLFIDNFGDMLGKFCKKERQRLREVLIQCSDIRIIGASAVELGFQYDYSEPFFEFFKVFHLEGLDEKETAELLFQLGKTYKVDTVKYMTQHNPGRVEALRRLTNGMPRIIVLLFEILLNYENENAFQDLEIILDRVTPFFKNRMAGLPPQKQEIVDVIALNCDAIGVKEISKKTRIPGKSVSAQLNELEKNRIITKISTSTKNNLYQISERFFNTWYLMRNGRNRERQKVLWLARFLESWCGKKNLVQETMLHSEALEKGNSRERNKVEALELAKKIFNSEKDADSAGFYMLVLLWNNELEEALQVFNIFIERDGIRNDDKTPKILLLLLAKKQYHYILKLFQENKFNIRDRYKPIYYALMVLMKDAYPDEYKKMGNELKQTVDEIIEKINQLAIDYA